MFEFTCPTCGKRVQGEDASSGQPVQCPSCHAITTAPGSSATAISEHAPKVAAPPVSNDATFREGEPPRSLPAAKEVPSLLARFAPLLILVVIGVTAAACLIPAVQKAHASAARTQSIPYFPVGSVVSA
jgi:hypothetical protein